jgi:flagellar basal-body rod protein FlgB
MVIDRILSGDTQRVLEKALKASGLTQEVIAHNLANVDTPGFKRSEVIFQEKLAAALAAEREGDGQLKGTRTDSRHLPIGEVPSPGGVEPTTVVRAETSLRPDGNNVDLDSEMVKLSQNTLLYQALAQLVRMKMTQLRSAISEGRK